MYFKHRNKHQILKLGCSELFCTVAGSHQVEKQHRNELMGMDMENTGKQCHQFGSRINIHSKTYTTLSTLSQWRLIYVMVMLIHLTCSLGYLTNWSPILHFESILFLILFYILIIYVLCIYSKEIEQHLSLEKTMTLVRSVTVYLYPIFGEQKRSSGVTNELGRKCLETSME